MHDAAQATHDAIDTVWRLEAAEVIGAIAVSQAHGPAAALPLVEVLRSQPQLAQYHLLPGVLADLLARPSRHDEARVQWLCAAELSRNARERELLLARAHNTLPKGGN